MGSLSGRGSDDAATGQGRSSPLIGVTTSEVRAAETIKPTPEASLPATRWRSGSPT